MSAAIVDTTTLGKAVLYSVVAGIGICVVFAFGISSAAGMLDALRERRTTAGALWAAVALLCMAGALAAVVFGVIAISAKS